ncbi:LPS translocon maturation chaperone LptM [Acinetobacter larvae]|uniref:Lipoprotein n=1 Tax=Acinetobacter larvae TaxID=1789224 RepID=A0A1B2M1F2_9GAMM|nr:lipoprotein [Acinetobacter larvae]AOA59022.1 hypothetical protein BFG52_12115 [Acinetobacter larvae]
MRILGYVVISAMLLQLAACGQTGALVLPNDQNQDKRSHYLLYPNTAPATKAPQTQKTSADVDSQKTSATVDHNTL